MTHGFINIKGSFQVTACAQVLEHRHGAGIDCVGRTLNWYPKLTGERNMKPKIILLSVALFVSCALLPAHAQDTTAQLYGAWKLVSFKTQIVGDSDPQKDVWGPNPKGMIIFMPNGRMMAMLTAPDRKRPANDAESAALLKSMNAYSGRYTVEADKFTTVVDIHHNEIYLSQPPQVRYFKLDGDKLTIRVPEQPSAIFPGKRVTSTLEWVREK